MFRVFPTYRAGSIIEWIVFGGLLFVTNSGKCDLVVDIRDAGAGKTSFNLNGSLNYKSSFSTGGVTNNQLKNFSFGTLRNSIRRYPAPTQTAGMKELTGDTGFFKESFPTTAIADPLPSGSSGYDLLLDSTLGVVAGSYWSNSKFSSGTKDIVDSFTVDLNFDDYFIAGTYTFGDPTGAAGDGVTLNILLALPPAPATGPDPAILMAQQAADQLFNSALPLNGTAGQLGSNLQQTGVQGLGRRLFSARARVNRGATGVTTRQAGSSSHYFRYREFAKKHEINLDGRGVSQDSDGLLESPKVYRDSIFSVEQEAASDFNPGVLTSGKKWELYATANFGEQRIDTIGNAAGMNTNLQASTIALEYRISEKLSVGAGWSHLWNDNTLAGNIGSADFEGDIAMGYATYFQDNFWADLLYSYGSYDSDIRRNTGFGSTVFGNPDQNTHLTSLNLGYNIPAGDTVVHGPTFGADYSTSRLDGYAERGDPNFNVTYGAQDFDSLITKLGWQVTWSEETTLGMITPQARVAYACENMDQSTVSSGVLVNGPVAVGGTIQNQASAGEGWMEIGLGVAIQPTDALTFFIDYTGQILRANSEAHYGSVSARLAF